LRFSTRSLLLIPAMILTVSGVAFGSGFSIFEQGAKATAMGGAFVATADDPSAIFYNVAGIAQQRRMSILGGGTAINFSNEFTGDPNDPFTVGVSGAEYKRHTFVPPNAYAIVPVGNNLTFGVGAFSAFGLRTNWNDNFIGRFISRDANVKTLSIQPSVAWQTTDGRLAIGAGAEYRRARISLNRNNGIFNPFSGRFSDVANVYLTSDWENQWGWNVGVLLKPTPAWRIGASYRTDMTVDFAGKAKFTQISTGNAQLDAVVKAGLPPNQGISTSINFPAIMSVGIATTLVPNWDLEADVTRMTWSRFQNLDIAFNTTPANNLHRPQNWHDSNSYRLGANHPVTPDWDVRFGVVYDENPQPTEGVGPLLPDADREGVSFGLGYHAGPFVVDVTEFLLHFKTRSTMGTSNDNFNGTYKTNANLISLNLGYRF
jgi:long-chain fatty acid transport protein